MCTDLETQADSYAVFISRDLDPDFITVGMVRQMLAEAYKQGYRDANDLVRCNRTCNQRILNIPEIVERMQIQHILNKLNDDERL